MNFRNLFGAQLMIENIFGGILRMDFDEDRNKCGFEKGKVCKKQCEKDFLMDYR